MGLYRNVAGAGIGSWLTDQLSDSGGLTSDTTIRLEPTGVITINDPGQPTIYYDPATNTPSTTDPTVTTTDTATTPLFPADVTPTTTITDPTPTTQAPLPPATAAQPDWYLIGIVGALVALSASNETFIPRGKKILYMGGVGVLYYLLSKRLA